jgi:uroporphyrinogen-III synthase
MHLIVTRPVADAADFAQQLQAWGHRVSIAPMLDMSFTGAPLSFGGVQAIVATSRNALRALAAGPYLTEATRLPLFVVGPGSAALARETGFTRIIAGEGGAEDLAAEIPRHLTPDRGAILYLSGDTVAFDLAPALTRTGFDVRHEVVYRSIAAATLPSDLVREIRSGIDTGVVLMSPRSARVFRTLITEAGAECETVRLTYFCLSPKVAAALGSPAPSRVAVASRPAAEEMLALVKDLASNHP